MEKNASEDRSGICDQCQADEPITMTLILSLTSVSISGSFTKSPNRIYSILLLHHIKRKSHPYMETFWQKKMIFSILILRTFGHHLTEKSSISTTFKYAERIMDITNWERERERKMSFPDSLIHQKWIISA